ncbi:hypothetical protein Tco_0572687 [Tanacetum coccineum]
MIQNEFITLSLAQFGQILKISYNGQVVFINEWDLSSPEFFQETEGPFYTYLPTPDEIHQFLRFEPEQQYNLAYFFVKRIESAKATIKAHLPYGMFLTCLFRYVTEHYPHLDNGIYNFIDRVMRPLVLKQTRKPQSDRGMPKAHNSVSSSSAHHYGSSSHLGDGDEDDGTSRASTPSPTTFSTPFHLSITKNTKFPPLLNKMVIFSSSDNLICSIKHKNYMKKLEEVSSCSEKH